jgi:DNA-binding transcriptional MerR regulator
MQNPVYLASDLQSKLEQTRGSPVPISTLKYWRQRLGITPDCNRLYTQEELDLLRGLVLHLKTGGTIEQYRRLKIMEIENGNQP